MTVFRENSGLKLTIGYFARVHRCKVYNDDDNDDNDDDDDDDEGTEILNVPS